MSILIHGKEYITVAERVQEAHEGEAFEKLDTEVLAHTPVVIKATVTIKGKTYTGISAANPDKSIEKQSPYEVAETSAIGRALGFAGFGIVEGIASADEMVKAVTEEETVAGGPLALLGTCNNCGAPNKKSKTGSLYCSNTCWLKK